MIQQQASNDIKVKQLEKENNDIRRQRNIAKEQLSKLTADHDNTKKQLVKEKNIIQQECDTKLKQLQREKEDVIDTSKKRDKQLKDLLDIIKNTIQHTKSGLTFLAVPEKG